MADSSNTSSGSEHTKAGDGRLFRNNIKSTTDASGRHVADRSPSIDTSGRNYTGQHRRD